MGYIKPMATNGAAGAGNFAMRICSTMADRFSRAVQTNDNVSFAPYMLWDQQWGASFELHVLVSS